MLFVQASQPSYCGNAFASSSCQTEYNGELESTIPLSKSGFGLLSKGGLRRNSSNLSQLSNKFEVCPADATQIEIDFSALTETPFSVQIQTPTGEILSLNFNQYGTAQMFTPRQSGCGHGKWTFCVYQMKDNVKSILATETMQLDGVGTLYFTVSDDFVPRLSGQEFLYMHSPCHKGHHH